MNRDMERYKIVTRRATILAAMKFGIFGVLGSRLAYLQVVEQQKYATLSDKNRISMRLLTAERGEILDRFGVPIAINGQNFRVFLTREQTRDPEGTLKRLSKIIPLSDLEQIKIIKDMKRKRAFTPVLVKENLTWKQMAQIEVNIPDLPGISVHEGKIRTYPLSHATAHLVGYVGIVSKSELTDDPVMSLPGFRIGKRGIEKKYDELLRGVVGTVQSEINATGREIREINRKDSVKGQDIMLTIDAELQMFVQTRLGLEKSACAVIMDTITGEVYAMASSPGFDPNIRTRGISAEQWEELLANPGKPLTDKNIAGQYPPGSTFKMITALAALENGDIGGGFTSYCGGYTEIGRDRFHCWKRGGHGKVGLTASLEQSCDVFFYDIARKTGIENIAKMARMFGLDEKTEIELEGEAQGLIPDKGWKLGEFGQKWQLGETVVAAIGQGYVQATPLQLATMTARLVNGGYAVKPSITRQIGNARFDQRKWPKMKLNPYHLNLVKKGMNMVTIGKKGTAKDSRIKEEGYSMGGKTGTAQVRRITRAQRAAGVKNEDLPWKFRHHALFVGYAPISNPRYACCVVVEHGVSGSGSAAPLAHDIMLEVQKRNPAQKHSGNMVKPKSRPKRTK